MNVSALHIFRTFDPTLDVDVTHLLARKECIIFENDIIRVPDDNTQLVTTATSYNNEKSITRYSEEQKMIRQQTSTSFNEMIPSKNHQQFS